MPSKKRNSILNINYDKKRCSCNHTGGAVYGLGFVGSAIYYISTATSFWVGALGVLKALVWPAFLVYELLKFLAM